MWQLGKMIDDKVTWDNDLIFDSFDSAKQAVTNIFAISGSTYVLKGVSHG